MISVTPHPQIVMTKVFMIVILYAETELIGEMGKDQVAVSHMLGDCLLGGHCGLVLSTDL
jgi:hypothetical protein